MRAVSVLPVESNRHTSTLVAWAENRAKLTPFPSQFAPLGSGRASLMAASFICGAFMFSRQREASVVPSDVTPMDVPPYGPFGLLLLAAENEVGELDQHCRLEVSRERRRAGEGQQGHDGRFEPEVGHALAAARVAMGVSFTGRLMRAAKIPSATE